jgi:DNA-binding IclR family transcriptional regulator
MYVMDGGSVKSAVRTMELLEFFANPLARATVMEVAAALGYPQSSTSMLLSSLVNEGYLHFEKADRTYRPTVRLMLLGARSDPHGVGEAVTRTIGELHSAVRQTVVVGIQQGIYVRQVFSINAKHLNPVIIPDGTLRPICRTAMGRVILAALSDDDVSRIARSANSIAKKPEDKVSVRDLLGELQRVRADGWARTVDYPAPDRSAIAVALAGIEGQPRMAISVGARMSVMGANLRSYVREIRAAKERLDVAVRESSKPRRRGVAGEKPPA